ncbi:MAG: DVUA0089 family protein [Planctomycetia bacterium]
MLGMLTPRGALAALLLLAVSAAPASAAIYIESTDAGDLPGTAAATNNTTGPLFSILGSIGAGNDVDAYWIEISNPSLFSASTSSLVNGFNSQLFLFDALGNGLLANDNPPTAALRLLLGNRGSILRGSDLGGSLTAGIYLLAISASDVDPISALGEIFDDLPLRDVHTADGPGASGPITGWNGSDSVTNAGYAIVLTGARHSAGPDAEPVPEPASLMVWGAAALFGGAAVRRRKIVPSA